MSVANNPYALYKLLPADNCGLCLLPSCMAFAAAVIRGEKGPEGCPRLGPDIVAGLRAELNPRVGLSQEQETAAAELRREVARMEFAELASRVGGQLRGERLHLCCLGKDFYLEPDGRMGSQCHVNAWVQLPLLRYLLVCKGVPEQGEWLPMAELAGGAAPAPLFAKRCEEPLRRLADDNGECFFDLLTMFAAREVEEEASGQRLFLLRPLPMLPLRLSYYPPEEGIASSLRIYFDRSAEENATPEMLLFLGTGIATMVEKILSRQ